MKSSPTTERVYFLDYLRVVACFMVILVHCIEPFYLDGVGTYIASHSDALWVTFINSLLRIAVPLFVMISSYLLVPVEGSTERFYRRRAERVALPFIIFSLAYAIIPAWGSGGEVDIMGNLKVLSLNYLPLSGHLWFVYMMLGVYLIMPIISPWLERVSARGERIFLAVWLFATAVPFIRELALSVRGSEGIWGEASWNEFGMLYYVSGFIGYVVAAHYIRKYVDWGVKKTLAIALPMLVAGYLITALPFYAQIPDTYPVRDTIQLAIDMELSWSFATLGAALQTLAVFLLFRLIRRPCKVYPAFEHLSKNSYGIYLAHMFVLVPTFSWVSTWGVATPIVMFASAILTMAITAAIIEILSILPKSKYIIG
ncbi:MAG: acyltransferase [Rikenellaceae bacterium]|nr:acyltransferase [Rikenellaceae bacterium]